MLDPEDSSLLINLVTAINAEDAELAVLTLLAGRLQADGGRIYQQGQCWVLGQRSPIVAAVPDLLSGFRINRVYTGDEVQDPQAVDQRALGLRVTDYGPTWLVLIRKRRAFQSIDTARLTAYAPHVQQVLKKAFHIAQDKAQQSAQAIAARRMGVGLVIYDLAGKHVQADAVAQDLLATQKLTLADLARLWPKNEIGTGQLIDLVPALDMLVLQHGPRAQIGLLRTRDTPLPPVSFFASALGVTLAEARLARALASGATLSEAALTLGLTTQTARFYSKQIFAKTGLSGQPALMRRVWTSALALTR